MEEKNIDYNVFNSLNLMNPVLGELYLKQGYNPFPPSYILNKSTALSLLNKRKSKVKFLEFLEKDNSSIKKHFETALKNTEALQTLAEDNLDFNSKIFIKNRAQLLKLSIEKIKRKNANALKLYLSLMSFYPEFYALLEDSFYERFNATAVLERILNFARENIKEEQKDLSQKMSIKQESLNSEETAEKMKSEEKEISQIDGSIKVNTLQAPEDKLSTEQVADKLPAEITTAQKELKNLFEKVPNTSKREF